MYHSRTLLKPHRKWLSVEFADSLRKCCFRHAEEKSQREQGDPMSNFRGV